MVFLTRARRRLHRRRRRRRRQEREGQGCRSCSFIKKQRRIRPPTSSPTEWGYSDFRSDHARRPLLTSSFQGYSVPSQAVGSVALAFYHVAEIESLSVTFHGHDLIVDSELELNYGRRYGLLGLNGCGKSTLLTAIGCRELPIPDHMDIHHLTREIEASDMSALEAVISCDEERLKLEKEAEALAAQDDGGGEALERIYERLDAMDASTAEKRAAEILFGLGFDKQMQAKKTRDFSVAGE
ncbi:P-loop containing nucleoside triphosphate hydrolase [Sesbania bispinosa]|nr:P-loop containing nucleoside triphosphate hydrolase [Sesbania bispinosa]